MTNSLIIFSWDGFCGILRLKPKDMLSCSKYLVLWNIANFVLAETHMYDLVESHIKRQKDKKKKKKKTKRQKDKKTKRQKDKKYTKTDL